MVVIKCPIFKKIRYFLEFYTIKVQQFSVYTYVLYADSLASGLSKTFVAASVLFFINVESFPLPYFSVIRYCIIHSAT